ncbi:cupin [Streptomyces xiamenensis]|uniref:Cupin domain protein n=1 Tax=Streptomyces xiamenensis TaxID=408015 RepID=A0A0F7FT38_9ACTN|nr:MULTISPECIES: cupin [Streptomyces]AKG42800.1 cupin domain protein [Streptomyces xiamenensis]
MTDTTQHTTHLNALAEHHLDRARAAEHGRSAHLFLHDGPLRQSVIALTAGAELEEHNAPPAASLYLVRGAVQVVPAGDGAAGIPLTEGEIMKIPQVRHSVVALEDAVLVLTSVTAVPDALTPGAGWG